jgi:hypothetical protein
MLLFTTSSSLLQAVVSSMVDKAISIIIIPAL